MAKKTEIEAEQRVVDFGIIFKYNVENDLKYFKLKDNASDLIGGLFSKLIRNIDELLKTWGDTIIINPALFKSY